MNIRRLLPAIWVRMGWEQDVAFATWRLRALDGKGFVVHVGHLKLGLGVFRDHEALDDFRCGAWDHGWDHVD